MATDAAAQAAQRANLTDPIFPFSDLQAETITPDEFLAHISASKEHLGKWCRYIADTVKYKIYLKNEYDAQKQTLITTFKHHEELNERYNEVMRSNKEYEKRDLEQQVIIAMTQKELAETRLQSQTQRQTQDQTQRQTPDQTQTQTQTQPAMTDLKDQQRSTTPPLLTNNDKPTGNKWSPKLSDADEY